MQEERYDLVDRDDNVIKSGLLKSEIDFNRDIIRVATLYLSDQQGKFYIAQRVASKRDDPLKYESPAHGKVNSGESYEEALMRESKEEIFLSPYNIEELGYFYYEFHTSTGKRRLWKKLFYGQCDNLEKYNTDEILDMISFDSLEDFLSFYENNTDKFSEAIAFDVSYLKKYFNK